MKVIKYLLVGTIALALWITAPIWMPSNYNSTSETSQTDTFVTEQKEQRDALLKAQDRELAELESKFGKKETVIPTLKKYWSNQFTDADGFEWLRCERIRAGNDGWIAPCSYRLKGRIQQDTYTVNNGKISL